MVMLYVRFFYVLIGENSTGEFMRKIYVVSVTCLLIAEVDRVFVSSSDVSCLCFLLGVQAVTGADIDIGFLSDQFKYSDQHRRRRNVL